jgi:poly(A) polymerase/tRNA nucleotidyltransferase (CCA-adding enzyme)
MTKNDFKIENSKIPADIKKIGAVLSTAGFEAHIIGGCVRDLLISREPKDWDIATDATPEQIIPLFPKTFYENEFGTVGVVLGENAGQENEIENIKNIIEITPYRIESTYSDNRHPDKVVFSKKIEDDLKRRDFTINAMALNLADPEKIIDHYNSLADLNSKTIRAVGDADKRFREDALRLMRAVRFAAELGFTIDFETQNSIIKNADLIKNISAERIRDELTKIIMSDNPMMGFVFLEKLGLLKYILPELASAIGIEQNQAHSFDVFEHLLRSLQCAADKKYDFKTRLAALLHDIGKPPTRKFLRGKGDYTFYGHEVVGAKIADKILRRLKFPGDISKKIVTLVRWHMFFSDTEQITLSAVRRIVRNVGEDQIWDLTNLRVCDRVGTGRPKEDPYRLRKYMSMIEEVLRSPVSVSKLKIDGNELMQLTGIPPGPKIGFILNILLEEVIDDQTKNTEQYLKEKSLELNKLELTELASLNKLALTAKENAENFELTQVRNKYKVR